MPWIALACRRGEPSCVMTSQRKACGARRRRPLAPARGFSRAAYVELLADEYGGVAAACRSNAKQPTSGSGY